MNSVQFEEEKNMFKKLESKEDILICAVQLVKEEGFGQLNIRSLAAACDVSTGTIYNYFPSKQELVAETVETIWRGIFHDQNCAFDKISFIDAIEWFEKCVRKGTNEFPEFLSQHNQVFMKKEKKTGKKMMDEYFEHIQQGLSLALRNDVGSKKNMIEANISEDELISFTLSNMISNAQKNQDTKTLKKVIESLIR